MALEDLDVGFLAYRRDQRAHDFPTGGIRGVQDAPVAVAALAAEVVFGCRCLGRCGRSSCPMAIRSRIRSGPSRTTMLDVVAVTESGAGALGIVDVGVEGVVGAPHRSDSALRICGGTLRQAVLAQDEDGPGSATRRAKVRPARPPPMTRKSAFMTSMGTRGIRLRPAAVEGATRRGRAVDQGASRREIDCAMIRLYRRWEGSARSDIVD